VRWKLSADTTTPATLQAFSFRREQNAPRLSSASYRGGGRRPQKHLLSGLLKCGTCGANLILTDRYCYGCSAHRDGVACSNGVRVQRALLEEKLLQERIFAVLASPAEVAKAAGELQAAYRAHVASERRTAGEVPVQLRELTARIERLRERLRQGDSDLPPDELQAAIERAESKRRDLEGQQPAAKASARLLAMLPWAAEEFRKQLVLGLEGSERDVLRARVALKRHFGGEIRLITEPDGGLVAHWNEPVGAVFQAAQVVLSDT
jgi:site-specific DNA recombinase